MEKAHNRASSDLLVGALCVELAPSTGEAPEWIHLLPLGPEIEGRDGRAWMMSDPDGFVTNSATELPAVLDYMHASEEGAPEAPAAGWIVELNVVREGDEKAPGIWGRVEWTPRGAKAVAEREYRFISPAFLFRKESGEVARLTSAGLVHKPNLTLTALNRRGRNPEENVMNEEQLKALCLKLGLPEDATHGAVMDRVGELADTGKALNARQEALQGDLESALNRAKAAEEKLVEIEAKALNDRIEAVLDEAQKAGKFAPASREFYRGLCSSAETLAAVEAEMAKRPALVAPESTAHEVPATNAGGRPSSLSDAEKARCAKHGIKEESYLLAKQQEWDATHGEEG